MAPKVSTHKNTVPEKWRVQILEPGQLESTNESQHSLHSTEGIFALADKGLRQVLILRGLP